MSKFCGNCGVQLSDEAKVCGNCGTPLEEIRSGASTKISGVDYVDPEKKKKNQKRIKLVLTVVILGIILSAAINIVSGFVGYKGLVRKVMSAYEDYDIETVVSLASDWYYCMDDSYVDDYFEGCIENDLAHFETQVGHKYKISYEIVDSYTMTNHKFEDLIDTLSYYEEFDADIISDVKVVEVEVTAKGDGTLTTQLELVLTKEAGKWRLLYLN